MIPRRLQPLEYGSDSHCLNERVPPAATGGTLDQNEAQRKRHSMEIPRYMTFAAEFLSLSTHTS
jgi:hypothetical protein